MFRSIIPIVSVCFALAACTGSGDEAPVPMGPPDASSLLQTDQAFAQLSADSGAVSAFSLYLAENAVQMPNGAPPIVGRESIVSAMASGPEFMLLWEPKTAEVAISGELGWTWGVYEARFNNADGEEVSSAGKYVNVWRKQDDGNWRVIVDMGNSGI